MNDWGEIKLNQIDTGDDFWSIIDEITDDHSGFLNNRNTLIDAYKKGDLYGLYVNETDKMYERGARMDDIFCKNSWYLLPCFCVKKHNTAILIWTHTRARKMGFGKKMIELLEIERAYNPLPESTGFWQKCNIEV